MVKRSSDPPGSPSRSQSSGTGPNASCGYCCPLCLVGVQYSGKIRFIVRSGAEGRIILWHIRFPLLTLIFISVAFLPRPLGTGMHFQTLVSSAEGAEDGFAKFTSLVRVRD